MVEPEKLKTEKDWLEAGRRVFEGLDDPPTRTNDPRALNYFSNPAAIKRDGMTVTEEGEIIGVRWVMDKDGELKISFAQCSACHTRVMEDGSTLRGTQGNAHFDDSFGIGMILASAGKLQAQQGLTPQQKRRLTFRFLDEALYALGLYIYSLKPPPNPNKFDAIARQGQRIFEREGCATCHTPPLYTNNKLIPVEGFDPPKDGPATAHLDVMEGMRIGTDPSLALKTRKGTGYYKVPSLKGLWYRTLTEHSGSIASLDDWFNPARLQSNYAPTGWRGPGVLTRALPGHPFGLKLSAQDKRTLIAFLKTL